MISVIASRIRKTNIHCQLRCEAIKPPIVGAKRGEEPITKTSSEKILALSSCEKKSRTMVMAATVATDAPKACKNLKAIKTISLDEKMQAKAAIVFIEEAEHNDIEMFQEYKEAVQQFIR